MFELSPMNSLSFGAAVAAGAIMLMQSLYGADSFEENFNEQTVSPFLLVPEGYVFGNQAQPVGSAQNTIYENYRKLIATTATDYNEVNFVFEITATIRSGNASEGAFVGIGDSTSGNFIEPQSSIYFRIFPSGFGGWVDVSTSNAGNFEILSTEPHPGDGTYRIRIQRDGNQLTFSCMTNYSGQPFSAHYTLTKGITNDLPFLNSTNSRLFFGVQGSNTTFDALSINAICSPHRARAAVNVVNGFVVGANIMDNGCGYDASPIVLIQGGGGSGATATAVIDQGKVIAINITSAGCCYTNLPSIEIASPPFVPTVNIAVSKVKVSQQVVLGRRYLLESTTNFATWSPVGLPFTATNENMISEFDADVTGRHFRIKQVP